MPRKNAVAKEVAIIDPAAPGVEITLEGKAYRLVFVYKSLALAERRLAEDGIQVNMLLALDFMKVGAARLPYLFYAALLKYQPRLTFAEVGRLITMDTVAAIHQAVIDAYILSMPGKREKGALAEADPTQGPPAK
jgi:hypothetical protein